MEFSWTLLMAPPPGGEGGGSAISSLIMFGAMAFIFYFMIFRPQKKRQKERQELLGKMEKGDKVMTSGGMHGTISAIEDNTVLIQVAEGMKIRFEKSAVTTIVDKK
jgi:preprotein translocase subunit YajC